MDVSAAANDELVFCELERRRVLSVNATFLSGILSIDIQPGLDPSVDTAVLLTGTDDQTFLVDTNGNGQLDGGELSGQIAELRRVVVDGESGFGNFAWYGDFRAANFENTALASINIRGVEDVTIGAKIDTEGFVTIRNIDGMVTLGGEGSYAGQSYVGELTIGDSLNVVSNTGIQQANNASLIVEGNARFESAGEISLATKAGDYLSIAGHADFISGDVTDRHLITVGAPGAESGTGPFVDLARLSALGSDVRVFESTSLELDQINVSNLQVFAGETIRDHSVANISIAEHSFLDARSIVLELGTFNTGTLQFQSFQDTLIFEDSDTNLLGASNAFNLTLSSVGFLRDADTATLDVAGDAIFSSQTGIVLADAVPNTLTVSGHASFLSPLDIQIGNSAGSGANFGEIGLYGRDVVVYEASSTRLAAMSTNPTTSVFANSLRLQSTGLIDQTEAIDVHHGSTFHLIEPGNILLARSALNQSLMDNQFGGNISISSDAGTLADVSVRDITSGEARQLGTMLANLVTSESMANLEVLLTQRALEFVGPRLNVRGDLQVVVGVDGEPLFSELTSSNQTITDIDGFSLMVGGDAVFRASGDIILADGLANELLIGGESLFVAGTQDAITGARPDVQIGGNATSNVQLGNLSVIAGDVLVNETNATNLRLIVAERLDLISGGSITDVDGANIDVRRDASFESLGNIILADAGLAGDQLRVGGQASFLAVANKTPTGNLLLDDVQIGDGTSSGAINALVELGSVDVVGRNVRLVESDATYLQRVIAALSVDDQIEVLSLGERLEIISGGSVQNTLLDGSSAVGKVYASGASIDAAEWLLLESSEFDTLSYSVGENLTPAESEAAYLRSLRNSDAVASSLDVFNEINAAFTRNGPAEQSLNPELPATLEELRARFDYEATHQGQYAMQVRNLGPLELSGGMARTDGLNVYVETVRTEADGQADLTITGPIVFVDDALAGGDFSGLVLVAGTELNIDAGGSLVSTFFEVYDTALNAFAFQGGEGLGGNFSTSRVLPLEASQLDPSTQHYQQQVATIFGNRSDLGIDRGFQHIVAYADGGYQFFDLEDAPGSDQADLLIRETPFNINFLTSWGSEQLPTSVVFRRAEGLFFYDSAGQSDLAATSFSATAASDFVNDVFVGTADPPIPPIVQPAPPPELPLVAPMLVLPEAPRTTIEIGSSVEVRPPSENVVEIYIAAIFWKDLDVAPENDRLERVEFERLEVEAGEVDVADFLSQRKREVIQLPSDRKLPTNATDEQIEALIEDIRKNTLAYTDDQGRPLFVEPVYGIIQSDPRQGESLWRLFMLRPESTDLGAEEAIRRSESSAVIGLEGNLQGAAEQNFEPVPEDFKAVGAVQDNDRGEQNGAAVPVAADRPVDAAVLPAALWAVVDRYNVRFDRASRTARRRNWPAS